VTAPQEPPVVVTDKRRFAPDGTPRTPDTPPEPVLEGEVEQPAAADRPADEGSAGTGTAEAAAGTDADAALDEMTATAQRVSAEYANYRKRVDRDRVLMVEMATSALLENLLPLLDDVDRARQHGDLTGGFKGVGEGLEAVVAKLGLERFGAAGEAFDPTVHEAVMAAEPDPDAAVAVCAQVFQQGFRLGSRVLRPARVTVAEPGPVAVPATASEQDAL